jgi:hypothetical protein
VQRWQALATPELHIPKTRSTVKVFIIDKTSHMSKFPASDLLHPIVPGFEEMYCRDIAFLVENPSSKHKYATLLLNLRVRED